MSNSQKFAKAWDAAEASGESQTVTLSGVPITISVRGGETRFTRNGQPVSNDYIRLLIQKEN